MIAATFNNMDRPHKHNAELVNPDPKLYIMNTLKNRQN